MWKALLLALALLMPMAGALPWPGAQPGPWAPAPAALLLDVAAPVAQAPAPDLPALRVGTLREELLALYALAGAVPTPSGVAALDARLAELPGALHAPLALVLAAMNRAAALRAEAFATVDPAELFWAREASLAWETLEAGEQARLLGLAARIQLPKMLAAGALVLAAIEASLPGFRQAAAQPEALGLSWADPTGSVAVGGVQDDTHAQDRTLLVDLGGNDVWSNNAGAMAPTPVIEAFPGCFTTGGFDCTVLHPKRNEPTIRSIVGRSCSADLIDPVFVLDGYMAGLSAAVQGQAAQLDPAALAAALKGAPGAAEAALATSRPDLGCVPQGPDDLGPWTQDFVTKGTLADADAHVVAVGIDLAGDDVFAPPRTFNFMNDGRNPSGCDTTSWGEAGKLWDRNVTAGSGFAGVGVLWDEAGNDFYGGRSITQGVGHVGGVGALVDRGAGRDVYEAVRFAQGMAFFAGAGLLYDDGGDDLYQLKNLIPLWNEFEAFSGCDVSTRDGQGRSNIVAVGALVDLAGNDVYYVQDHLAEGYVLPGASRDDPTTTQGSTGFRLNLGPSAVHDFEAIGRGLLWDRAGLDTYSRPGRGNGCFDSGGTFLDEGASLLASLGPCPSA